MSSPTVKRINIFLSIDHHSMAEYFNMHDPAPLYKRQLSHLFEQYILNSINTAKRYTVFRYSINCRSAGDKQYIDPLIMSIRRHFAERLALKEAEFEKFKRRTYILLFASLTMVMACQGTIPMLIDPAAKVHSGLVNSLDVFSWVILWQPIDKLIFHWNPFLKEISTLKRLAKAEINIQDEMH
jgi:hypothetical protein